jgi:metal-responsive CopG/Arc/MetJ family transcriptional regulator
VATKVMISFPEAFLKEVDRIAHEEHRSRSELVREALRSYIEARQNRRMPGDMPQIQRAVATQDALARSSSGSGEDSTVELRRWREAHS